MKRVCDLDDVRCAACGYGVSSLKTVGRDHFVCPNCSQLNTIHPVKEENNGSY